MDIQLRNLSIGYRHGKSCSVVMQNIDAEIKPGRLTCLIGSNGAGKSTLLRTISAFQPKLGGEIMLGDREIAEYSREELARIIGVVLTERPQVQNLTVFQMAAMGRSPYTGFFGRLDEEDKKIVAENMYENFDIRVEHSKSRQFYNDAFKTSVNYDDLMNIKKEFLK